MLKLRSKSRGLPVGMVSISARMTPTKKIGICVIILDISYFVNPRPSVLYGTAIKAIAKMYIQNLPR